MGGCGDVSREVVDVVYLGSWRVYFDNEVGKRGREVGEV